MIERVGITDKEGKIVEASRWRQMRTGLKTRRSKGDMIKKRGFEDTDLHGLLNKMI